MRFFVVLPHDLATALISSARESTVPQDNKPNFYCARLLSRWPKSCRAPRRLSGRRYRPMRLGADVLIRV